VWQKWRMTYWMIPLDVPTSLRTTNNQIICHCPVTNVKPPRPSDVPKSELQMTSDWEQKPLSVVGTYAYTAEHERGSVETES